MNILVLSIAPWRTDNSVGNTLSNIFDNFPDAHIANIYLKPGKPKNEVCQSYFHIDEKLLLKRKCGESFTREEILDEYCVSTLNQSESEVYDKLRQKRYTILFIIRELIWKLFSWKSKELKGFVKDFAPDVIFLLLNETVYSNKIALYVQKIAQRPMVGYLWDDIYRHKTKKNPIRFLYQTCIRRAIKKAASKCSCLYTISEIQRKEYSEIFQKECRLLWKGMNFSNEEPIVEIHSPIRLLYTGNLGLGRYKQLEAIGEALQDINAEEKVAELNIYTLTPITDKMKKALERPDFVRLNGAVSAEKVQQLQREADILIHVESFEKQEILAVRQSFSTKIVDYFYQAKCIFAVGPKNVASVDYLRKNDAAVVAVSEEEIRKRLAELLTDKEKILAYGQKAWDCGKKNHQIAEIQRKMQEDFKELINETATY